MKKLASAMTGAAVVVASVMVMKLYASSAMQLALASTRAFCGW